MTTTFEAITSEFWNEIAQSDNPFTAQQIICCGYDVVNDLLPHANFIEYLYLLIKHDKPTAPQRQLLNAVAIALANPGPRDHGIRAAMSGAAGGSTMASCLMAALAVGAGNLGGSRELFLLMRSFEELQTNMQSWQRHIDRQMMKLSSQTSLTDVDPDFETNAQDAWLALEHVAGFDPYGVSCPEPIMQCLDHFNRCGDFPSLQWLQQNRATLETQVGQPITLSFVVAAAFSDLEIEAEAAEMLHLLLRLPGAAAHTLEQRQRGWQDFPFYGDRLIVTNDPGQDHKTEELIEN